jgi:tetratricopeptide (TPR) repeat protein
MPGCTSIYVRFEFSRYRKITVVSIKTDPENVDDVRLVIKGDIPQIIKLKDRDTAGKLNYETSLLFYQIHTDNNAEHTIDIDGVPYTFPLKVWHSIMKALDDEWLGYYMHAEFPDDEPDLPAEPTKHCYKPGRFRALEYLEKADRLYDQGERERAISVYGEAVNFDAGLVIAYKNLGLTAGELSQFDLALDNFNKLIEMEDEEALNYRHRGAIYYYLSLFDEALSDFSRAINIDENYADAYYWRGLVNLELSPKQSIEDFSKAIELDPDNEKHYLDRACAHSMEKDFKSAKNDVVSSIKINPDNPSARRHLDIFNELLEGKIDGIEIKKKT